MHNSIGIITSGKLCLNYHRRLFYFPYEKGYFLELTA